MDGVEGLDFVNGVPFQVGGGVVGLGSAGVGRLVHIDQVGGPCREGLVTKVGAMQTRQCDSLAGMAQTDLFSF